jgi:hypothetical protein
MVMTTTFTNKYALLVIINLPLLLIAIIGTLANYNTKHISKKRATVELIFWCLVGFMLVLIEPIYNTLIRHHLTNSAPMNIFDVVLLTMVLLCVLLIKQVNDKAAKLNKKIARLHESIVIAEEQRHWDKDK